MACCLSVRAASSTVSENDIARSCALPLPRSVEVRLESGLAIAYPMASRNGRSGCVFEASRIDELVSGAMLRQLSGWTVDEASLTKRVNLALKASPAAGVI